MTARICIVTAGHLATCPRMLKAADALSDAGYRVRVISGRSVAWATAADHDVARARAGKWTWSVVDWSRASARRTWLATGLRQRAARTLARAAGAAGLPLAIAARAYARPHGELVRAAVAEPADLYLGGTNGALAAVAAAARRAGVPFGLDLEDFHSGESHGPAASLAHALARRIERTILPRAAFLTTSSAAIACAYAAAHAVRPIVVHNTFALPTRPPALAATPGHPLRLYWFSHTIGPGRGLEDAVRAAGLAGIAAELHLRGVAVAGYVERLVQLGRAVAPALRIVQHGPASPDRMVDLCAGHDVGLALEPGRVPNSAWCLSNKSLTYVLGGLALALTDTPGQRVLARDIGTDAVVYRPGDVATLGTGLARWVADRELLARAKAAAWHAARRRWHWDHPDERGALVRAVAGALGAS